MRKQAETFVLTVRRRLCGKYFPVVEYRDFRNGCYASVFLIILNNTKKEGFTISKNELQVNEMIRDNELRIISAEGEQLGVMDAKSAQKLAMDAGLDLVKISPNANPPVCKIMDFGKYKFELAKREKENRKNQKVVNIKEVQLSPSIDTNDFNTKAKQAMKFLKSGDKVRVKVRFRGRELSHSEIGKTLLDRFAETVEEFGTVEKPAKLEGRQMIMFLAPKAQ